MEMRTENMMRGLAVGLLAAVGWWIWRSLEAGTAVAGILAVGPLVLTEEQVGEFQGILGEIKGAWGELKGVPAGLR